LKDPIGTLTPRLLMNPSQTLSLLQIGLQIQSKMEVFLSDNFVLATTASSRKQPDGVSVPLSSSFLVTQGFLVYVAALA